MKRELNLSNKKLHQDTPEDIILKSPMRIPSKDLQELRSLKNVNLSHYAFYDISKTEKQSITWRGTGLRFLIFQQNFSNTSEMEMKMGNINNT